MHAFVLKILDFVIRLREEIFSSLKTYCMFSTGLDAHLLLIGKEVG
jgi:hypothetical protein